MARSKQPTRTVGQGKCPHCDKVLPLKVNAGGHLYMFCPKPVDGGCGISTVGWDARSDELIAAKYAIKWTKREEAERFRHATVAPSDVADEPVYEVEV